MLNSLEEMHRPSQLFALLFFVKSRRPLLSTTPAQLGYQPLPRLHLSALPHLTKTRSTHILKHSWKSTQNCNS
eukprot:COSAG02_NODE_659_length_18772_cov_14.955015_8_plen_73_part_00